MLSKTARPSSMALTMLAKLSSVRIMSAASLATSVPRDTHGHADIGDLQGRCVVHSVAGHGYDVPHALEHHSNTHLVLGRNAREEHVLGRQRDTKLVVGHVVEVAACDDAARDRRE